MSPAKRQYLTMVDHMINIAWFIYNLSLTPDNCAKGIRAEMLYRIANRDTCKWARTVNVLS